MKQRNCDGCKFCCWAFNVEVPVARKSLQVMDLKPERSHCRHECAQGCALHDTFFQPIICHDFLCPYLGGSDIHRPDTFQLLIQELAGDMGNFIPVIPRAMDVEFASTMIRETRSIPAAILLEGQWVKLILPLDRQPDGSWVTDEMMTARWQMTI